MDRKSITILAVCIGLLLLWPQLVTKIFPPTPLPPGATNRVAAVAGATNTLAANVSGNPAATSNTPGNPGAVAAAAGSTVAVVSAQIDTNAPEQLIELTNSFAHYTFTSRGGGLKLVELVRYPETVSALRKKKTTVVKDVATLNEAMPLPVWALLDDGAAAGDGIFQLARTATGVRAEKTLANGLVVVKEFVLETNYLIAATVRLENRGTESLAMPARELVVGAATPLGPHDNGQFVGVMWYNGAESDDTANQAWFANQSFMSCMGRPSIPRTEYRGGSNNVAWVSAHNQFFTMAAMPESPAAELVVRSVPLPRDPDMPVNSPNPMGYQAALAYPATSLTPGQVVEQKIHIFAGPKEYRTLAAIAARFDNNVDLVMGYGGFFGGFARVLLLAMNWFAGIGFTYGWAIITITIIIKLAFWPLTQASTRSMKRMAAMQPQMAAIKEKYKDDPAKMNKKTMEFMKEHKINPIGGCLPMLIQLPIFIGFYQMIQSAIELRGAPFLWIGDLSNPDTLFIIPGLGMVPFLGIPGVGLPFNLLPLIMGATQIWQIRLTPPSPGMDPAQQRIMRWMPIMFIGILYNFSAGLTLYWTVQNLLTIVQTKLTKDKPEAVVVPAVAPKKK